jgi:hypothetical protein
MTTICRLLMTLPLFLALVLGCNKNSTTPSSVSGKITYKGEIVPAGSITFHTPEGGIFSYSLKEGTYSGTDLPAVEMIVTIETESANPKGPPKQSYGAAQGRAGADPSDMRAKMEEMGKIPASAAPANAGGYVKIPVKYASKDKSPLKVTLTKGKNVNDFDLTD